MNTDERTSEERASMDRTIEAHAALTVLEERIRVILGYRAWFRRYPWANDVFNRRELNAELRVLIRVLRQARRIALEAQNRTDPMTAFKATDPTLAAGDHFRYPA